MNITADAVKQLRERTGAGMMECKKALVETKGDLDAAAELMRKQGLAKADKKATRVAAEGVVVHREVGRRPSGAPWSRSTARPISSRASTTSAVRAGRSRARRRCAARPIARGPAGRRSSTIGESVDERRRALMAKIGENISVRRFARARRRRTPRRLRARHAHRRAGRGRRRRRRAGARPGHARRGQQPAATSRRRDVPADVVAKEREILTEQAQRNEGKPPEIVAKMVEGRLRKSLDEITLAGQPFVKDPELTIEKLLKGAKASVAAFERFEVGAGIEKKQEDFVAEVMAQVKGSRAAVESRPSALSGPRKTPPRRGFFYGSEHEQMTQAAATYPRILVKLSGEALLGSADYGIDPAVIKRIAGEMQRHPAIGVQVASRDRRRQHLPRRGPRARRHGPRHRRSHGHARHGDERARHAGCARKSRAARARACPRSASTRCARTTSAAAPCAISRRAASSFSPPAPAIRSSPPIRRRALRAIEINADLLLKATKVNGVYLRRPDAQPEGGAATRASRSTRCSPTGST